LTPVDKDGKKQPEKYEIQAEWYEECRHPWLENAYALIEENYGHAQNLCGANL
jgi:hypothetical protein